MQGKSDCPVRRDKPDHHLQTNHALTRSVTPPLSQQHTHAHTQQNTHIQPTHTPNTHRPTWSLWSCWARSAPAPAPTTVCGAWWQGARGRCPLTTASCPPSCTHTGAGAGECWCGRGHTHCTRMTRCAHSHCTRTHSLRMHSLHTFMLTAHTHTLTAQLQGGCGSHQLPGAKSSAGGGSQVCGPGAVWAAGEGEGSWPCCCFRARGDSWEHNLA